MKQPRGFLKKQKRSSTTGNRTIKLIGLIFAGLFFLIALLTLPHYGINWDEPNHLLRGQAYLHFFLTGKKDYADLPANFPRRSLYQNDGYTYSSLIELKDVLIDIGHPPLGGILSSLTNYIFFQKLGWLPDIEAYHLYGLFLVAGLTWVLFVWAAENYGLLAGLVSCLSLALYPLFWAESHFNTQKDIPEAVFYSLTIIFFWSGITRKSWRRLILSSFFCGLALATKLNIVFVPLIVIPWLVAYFWPKIRLWQWPLGKKMTWSLLFYPVLSAVIFFGCWPRFWSNPVGGLLETLGYYRDIGTNRSFDPRFLTFLGINTYAAQWILFTTPLVILFFSTVGVIYTVGRGWFEEKKTALLILFWLLVPILRVTTPGMGIYGGVRQIMEYIPAMALLSGIGAKQLRGVILNLIQNLYRFRGKPGMTKKPKLLITHYSLLVTFLLSFLPITFKLISIHPNENVYFNPLIGGLSGAKAKDIPAAGNTFGNDYRQGIDWINENVKENAKLAFAYEMMSNLPQIWVRPDINFSNLHRSGYLRQGEYVIGLPDKESLEKSYFGRYLDRFLEPVYEIKVDGVAILKVWKNDAAHLKPAYLEEERISYFEIEINQDSITIDLQKEVLLSRIELVLDERHCSPLKEGYFYLATDDENWLMMPEVLPAMWPVVVLGDQPAGGKLIYPFAAEKARFIKIRVMPEDVCVKKIISADIYQFSR